MQKCCHLSAANLLNYNVSKPLSGNAVNALSSSDLNSICRNEVQTSRFEDASMLGVPPQMMTKGAER